MTNESIKLNREIALEKKVSPQESDHIWDCNWIRQATASETTEIYCALKSCKHRPVVALPSLSLDGKLHCALLGFGVGPVLKRRHCDCACTEGCCAGNGIAFSKCVFKAWARPGQPGQTIYWQVNISTASTAEQRILGYWIFHIHLMN